jgi:hypothetical protein
MNGIRRALILAGLTLAVIIGASFPAFAGFSDSVTVAPRLTTATVSAPTNVSTAGTYCAYWQTWNGWTWVQQSELRAKVSWNAAQNTRNVTGYRITAVMPDGSKMPVQDVPAGQLSVTGNFPTQYAYAGVRVTVTTLTAYGWTKESAAIGPITC